jgi:DNA-binding MarR family transcriptional regulator
MGAELDTGDGGLWLTISELAKREGVGKPTISERVKRLEADGLVKSKPGRGRQKLVNLAQYLVATNKAGDAAKQLAADTRAEADAPQPPEPGGDPTYRAAQTRRAQLDADLKEIELAQKRGELLPVADIEDAAGKFAEAIVRVLDRIPTRADEIAAAVGRDGTTGARAKLKEIVRDLRTAVAESVTLIAAGATLPQGGADVS